MNAVAVASVVVGGVFSLLSCSEQKKDTWYEYSSGVQSREKEFVEHQMISGMSEVEAKKLWDLEYSIEMTRYGRPAGGLEGRDLQDKMDP